MGGVPHVLLGPGLARNPCSWGWQEASLQEQQWTSSCQLDLLVPQRPSCLQSMFSTKRPDIRAYHLWSQCLTRNVLPTRPWLHLAVGTGTRLSEGAKGVGAHTWPWLPCTHPYPCPRPPSTGPQAGPPP